MYDERDILSALRLMGSVRISRIRCKRVVEFVIWTLICTAATRVRTCEVMGTLAQGICAVLYTGLRTLRSTCSGVANAYIFVMVARAASMSSLRIMIRAIFSRVSVFRTQPTHHANSTLTRLREEE